MAAPKIQFRAPDELVDAIDQRTREGYSRSEKKTGRKVEPWATLGEKLRDARQSAGVSVDDLAELLDVAPNTIYRWENDRVEPSVSTLERVAEALGMTLRVEFREVTE